MFDPGPLTTTRISKTLDIPGYVIDSEILERIDRTSKQSIVGANDTAEKYCDFVYWITTSNKEMLKFEAIDSLLAYVDSEPVKVKSISFQYISKNHSGINLVFDTKGKIELLAYSNSLDFQFNMDKLTRDIQICDQDYSWFIKAFIFPKKIIPITILSSLIFFFSIFLLYNVGYYFYALNVGVNIDPSIIPEGNTYFQEVEEAIRSPEISKKLNVLLLSQLKNFKNVQDIIIRQERYIIFWLVSLIIICVITFVYIAVKSLYPLTFFSFGNQKKILLNLRRKREIWGIVIVIGFLVNLIAGFLVALLT